MIRLMLPAMTFASPALAHGTGHVHVHTSDFTGLGLGMALFALAVIGVAAIRFK